MESIVIVMATPLSVEFREFLVPKVQTVSCPIEASLGVLGRKWALLVLRDIAFYRNVRFSDILQKNFALTPRVLTFRLRELQRQGFIKRVAREGSRKEIFYELTSKGSDAVPILAAFLNFGYRHHAKQVFEDGKPRTLGQVLPGAQCELLGALASYALDRSSRNPARVKV